MRRFYAYLILGIICSSCSLYGEINLEQHYFEVDYKAQEVILKTDGKIILTGIDCSESGIDFNSLKEYYSENSFIQKGEWFSIVLDHSNKYQLRVVLDENTTGKDRKLKVMVERRVDNDSAVIVQKAKATQE